MVPLSKSGVRKHRGFESRPLRHTRPPRWRPMRALPPPLLAHAPSGALAPVLGRRLRLDHPRGGLTSCAGGAGAHARRHPVTLPARERSPSGLWRRTGNAVWGNPSRVRIPPSPPLPRHGWSAPCARWRLRSSLTYPRVRSLRSSDAAFAWTAHPRRYGHTAETVSDHTFPSITPLLLSEFRFPDPELAGRVGVVVGYAVRHPGGILLFDTGFGFGNAKLEAAYHPVGRPIGEVLAAAGIEVGDITEVVNCHLHADHAGQNAAFPGIPIYVQPVEWELAHTTDHTILEWIDFPGARYEQIAGRPPGRARHPGRRDPGPHGRTPIPGRRRTRRPDRPRRPGLLHRRRMDGRPGSARGTEQRPGPGRVRPLDRALARAGSGPGPLRPRPRTMDGMTDRSGVSFPGRARRGTSGAL